MHWPALIFTRGAGGEPMGMSGLHLLELGCSQRLRRVWDLLQGKAGLHSTLATWVLLSVPSALPAAIEASLMG